MKKTNVLFGILILFFGLAQLNAQQALTTVTENGTDYWLISSKADLVWLSMSGDLDATGDGNADFADIAEKWGANYRLTQNIVFIPVSGSSNSVEDYNNSGTTGPSAGWLRIGTQSTPFTGHFDGQGYKVENLFVARGDDGGFFGYIVGATIENLQLVNIRVLAPSGAPRYFGGLVARANENPGPGNKNIIRQCMVTGEMDLTASTQNNIESGGIAGRLAYAEVSSCYVNMDITSNVVAGARRIGGIAGQVDSDTDIINSYSISDIVSATQSGVFVGRVAGANVNIENSYAVGTVSSGSQQGVFVGLLSALESMVSCYYEVPGTGATDGVGSQTAGSAPDLTSLTPAQFGVAANFTGWDFDDVWEINDVDGVDRPVLQWEPRPKTVVLNNAAELIWLSDPDDLEINGIVFADLEHKWASNYILNADIVFDANHELVDWNGDGFPGPASGFSPIGTNVTRFTGTFNGNGHKISNLFMNRFNYCGFFGGIENATIENLYLDKINYVARGQYIGGLAGRSYGADVLKNVAVRGNIHLDSDNQDILYAGGLIGRLGAGEISGCYTMVNMDASSGSGNRRRVGGIVGQVEGSAKITDSFTITDLVAGNQSGVFAGRVAGAGVEISDCYSVGSIQAVGQVLPARGLFIGLLDNANSIASCYYQESDEPINAGIGANTWAGSPQVSPLTLAQFANQSSFSGWDFGSTWEMGTVGQATRPLLQWSEPFGPAVDPLRSFISATEPHFADGTDYSLITITVNDYLNLPVEGLLAGDFDFIASPGTAVGGFQEIGNGVYTFRLTSSEEGTVSVEVLALGTPLGTLEILFEAPIPVPLRSFVLFAMMVLMMIFVAFRVQRNLSQ